MIFQHTIDKVLSGAKTRTSRIIKDGERFQDGIVYTANGRMKWQEGKTYAVQAGRGMPSVARIKIKNIFTDDVRKYTDTEARWEGFNNVYEFWQLWRGIHDKNTMPYAITLDWLSSRPAKLYTVWVIDFELVKDASNENS